jgi:hypothetical protein
LRRFGPGLDDHITTSVQKKYPRLKVDRCREKWLAGHVARLASRHMVSYRLGQVGGAPPQPYKCSL